MNDSKELTEKQAVEAYMRASKFATPSWGFFASISNVNLDLQSICVAMSQPDVEKNETTFFMKSYILSESPEEKSGGKYSCLSKSLSYLPSNIQWHVPSYLGNYTALLIRQHDKTVDFKQFIEIWSSEMKLKTIDVSTLHKHGVIIGRKEIFGCLEWSHDEEYLLYIAEKKRPKVTSFFDKSYDESNDGVDKKIKGAEHEHFESWGEQLTNCHHTVVCKLHIATGTTTILDCVPDEYSAGQAVWGPNGDIVFVGWCQEPYRLGLTYCLQRKSKLFVAKFGSTECDTLSENGRAVCSPCFSPDMSRLVYLDMDEGGPHNQCCRLMMIDWKGRSQGQIHQEVIVDVIDGERLAAHQELGAFQGIYTGGRMDGFRHWLDDGIHILLQSVTHSFTSVWIINTVTRVVRRIFPYDKWPFRESFVPPQNKPPFFNVRNVDDCSDDIAMTHPNEGFSWSCYLMDVFHDQILLHCSCPSLPPFIVVGHLHCGTDLPTNWISLSEQKSDQSLVFDDVYWNLFTLHPPSGGSQHCTDGNLGFDSFLCMPKSYKADGVIPPLVLYLHGGPHSSFSCNYSLTTNMFLLCGFAVLYVNYGGSIGFGQSSIQRLLGHIGDFDVRDCMLALQYVKDLGFIDCSNIFVIGGSHGGFLTAHLIGQFPDEFKGACLQNPVINIASMVGCTDITDWCFVEAGLQFRHERVADGATLKKLYNMSPIAYIDKVKTPVLLQIGLKDLRVPPAQSFEYYKGLKARSVPVKCLTYAECNHSLLGVDVEADCIINCVLWFSQHI